MQTSGKKRGSIILRQITGYSCIAAGVAGCVLPIIPGIPLLFVALGVLAVDSPRAARLRDRLKDYAARQLSRKRKGDKSASQDSAY
jgi:uncharacterized membrane protein YbaN (DUF454 family)